MRYIFLVLILALISCNSKETNLTAQQIIDRTIVNSNADKITNAKIDFVFRDIAYEATRKMGKFELNRAFDSIKDVLTNESFTRYIDGKKVQLKDSLANLYSNSVNSVHYFSVLPYGLNDKAVRKKLLPSSIINKKEYYKVEITFSEDGGGEDFEDVFIYWIGKEDFLIDYFAYSYHTDGGGKRFRAIKNQLVKEGIRFVNFDNYKPKDQAIKLINLDKAFENSQLEKLSEIILEDVQVQLLN